MKQYRYNNRKINFILAFLLHSVVFGVTAALNRLLVFVDALRYR